VAPGQQQLEVARRAFRVEREARAEETALADVAGAVVGVVFDAVRDLAAVEVALMRTTCSLSLLMMTVPFGARFSSSSRFAAAIFSIVPKNSMCTGAMFV
jgi:hypothetical protein